MKEFREISAAGAEDDPVRAAREGAARLREGSLLVHPTCTVYGLGAGPDGEPEIRRLKGGGRDRPLLRIAAGRDQILASHPDVTWNEHADILARSFWPGPLTLVLDDGTADGIGVRVEEHPLARELLAAYGATMPSSSLNRTGYPPARTAEEVRGVLQRMPEPRMPLAFLDGGDLPPSSPSTILSLRSDPPEVLRVGALPLEDLRSCLGGELALRRT